MAKSRAKPKKTAVPTTAPAGTTAAGAVVELLRARAQRWVDLPNVTSVGVGYKEVGGVKTGELSIQVTVARKLSPADVKSNDLEPLPKFVVGADGLRVPVDVIERSYAPSFLVVPEPTGSAFNATAFTNPRLARRSWLSRIMPGVSVSSLNGLAGTIGAIVYDNATGLACVLSNAHVLAEAGGQLLDPVVQPGRSDDADISKTTMGRLLRWHVGLAGDCAIASIDQRLYEEAIFELGVVPRRIAKAEIGDTVIKSGRTTGVTQGVVERIGVVFPIGGSDVGGFEIGPAPGSAGGPISDGGDSGCVWMVSSAGAATDIALGLHFAAETNPMTGTTRALACNIHSVLDKMDVSLSPRT